MNLLLKGVTIADPNSPYNKKNISVRVVGGRITAISENLLPIHNEDIFECKGSILSPGFFDMNCLAGDPGFETKENLESVAAAAAAGGFTGLALMPQTQPVVQSKAEINYIYSRTFNFLVTIYPIGAISRDLQGKELAEMYDMLMSGAVAFSDGSNPIDDDGFMSRALQYADDICALLMVYPENKAIAGSAQINESKMSVSLGMKGIPAVAEEMQISRDIILSSYQDAQVHICNISTAGSVELIRKAKKDGVKISCDVAAHHLVFTEELLHDFDSNYKVKPPLRADADVSALLKGLKDGTIDAITSQHRPHEKEHKQVEFEIAAYGMISLQTVLPLLLKAGLSIDLIVENLSISPRLIMGLPLSIIKEGEPANFTLFNPEQEWVYDQSQNYSLSSNSPLLGQTLKGRVQLVYNNNRYIVYG